MAINLSKAKSVYNTAAEKSGMTGESNSWTDFYLNMALEMAENVAKNKIGANDFSKLRAKKSEVKERLYGRQRVLDKNKNKECLIIYRQV